MKRYMGDQAKERRPQTQHPQTAGMAVIAANLHISGTSLCGWGSVSGAQWRMGACDYIATLQGCIWGYEAACLQVQSGEWVGPTGVLGSAVPMSLPLHSPV